MDASKSFAALVRHMGQCNEGPPAEGVFVAGATLEDIAASIRAQWNEAFRLSCDAGEPEMSQDFDRKCAEAYRGLEYEIANARGMALVFDHVMEAILVDAGGVFAELGKPPIPGQKMFMMTDDQFEMLFFAMHELTGKVGCCTLPTLSHGV